MATSAKAHALAHELADRLKNRVIGATSAVVESVDTDSNPLITIGTLASTNRCALVKVSPLSWPLGKDILGLDQSVYTPHVVKILVEALPLGGLTRSDLMNLLGQVSAMGCVVELYETASGGFVAADIADATKLVDTYQPDQWHPLVSGQ